jgi:hypothetical protein
VDQALAQGDRSPSMPGAVACVRVLGKLMAAVDGGEASGAPQQVVAEAQACARQLRQLESHYAGALDLLSTDRGFARLRARGVSLPPLQLGQAGGRAGRAATPKACSYCGALDPPGSQICKACRTTRYCGRDCQAKHWPEHKADCRRVAAEKKAAAE